MSERSYMSIIFIDGDNACKTNLQRAADSNAETLREFRSLRRFEVGIKSATFLIDYYNACGDLSDTICVDNKGFKAIVGREPERAAFYRKIDRDYWRAATSEPHP